MAKRKELPLLRCANRFGNNILWGTKLQKNNKKNEKHTNRNRKLIGLLQNLNNKQTKNKHSRPESGEIRRYFGESFTKRYTPSMIFTTACTSKILTAPSLFTSALLP